MQELPLISLIIPAYNEERDIAKTLEPLRELQINKEIIVADGGSKDQTVEIAKELADKVYERNDFNKNIAENRNKGASVAEGRYYLFIDCGAKIDRLPKFISYGLSLFEAEKDLVALTLKIKFFAGEENIFDKFFLAIINASVGFLNFLGIGVAMGWVMFIKADAFKKINGFNENIAQGEDSELFRRLGKIGKIRFISRFWVYGPASRYHQGGWLKAIGLFFINFLWIILTGRSYTKNWIEAK